MRRGHADELCRDSSRTSGQFGRNDAFDVVDHDEHVFRFEIGVNNAALGVQIVETHEHLLGDLLDNMLRNASMLIPLDQAKQVLAEHLEYHTYVGAVGTLMPKVVDEADDVTSPRVGRRRVDDPGEELDFVECSLRIVPVGFDHFERYVPFGSDVSAEQAVTLWL